MGYFFWILKKRGGIDLAKYKIFILLAGMVFSGLVSVFMGHYRDWDFLNYHFYDGFSFFYDRLNLDYWPADGWSFFNPLLDAFNYALIMAIPHGIWVSFLMGFFGGWGLFVFYETASLVFGSLSLPQKYQRLFVCLAYILGVCGPFVLKGMGSVENDLQSGSFVLLGLYFALKALIHSDQILSKKSWGIFVSGIFLGISIGLKLTNMTSLLALGIAILLAFPRGQKLRLGACFALGAVFSFLVTNGGWMWVLFEHFKNPLYPFYNKIFHSPYFPLINIHDPTFVAKGFWDVLSRPFSYMNQTLVSEGIFQDWRFGVSLIFSIIYIFKVCILPSCAPETRTRSAVISFLMIYCGMGYLIWVIQFGIYRYAIPLEIMSALLILLLSLEWFSSKTFSLFFKDWQRLGVIIGVVIFILWKTTVPVFFNPLVNQPYLQVSDPGRFPPHALVILTGEKQSFVIPFFPHSLIFVSTNLSMSSRHRLDSDLAVRFVQAYQGPIFVLFGEKTPDAPHQPVSRWERNGLIFEINTASCRKIITNELFQPELRVCEAKKINAQK